MSVFVPTKLTTTYDAPVTPFRPVEGRKYTLTHSDTTGQLFLSIGYRYNYASVNQQMRDEVLAEWVTDLGEFSLVGSVYVSGGEFDENYSKVRFMIFQKELKLALKAITYGDRLFYRQYPWLLDAPIYIRFESIFPQFQKLIYYGTPRQYLYS